jgi:hypothetical protein
LILYAIVFLTGLAGMTHFSWWAAAVGGCLLSLKLVSEDRTAPNGDVVAWEVANIASNAFISAVASVLAFAAGRITATLWGL